MKDRLRVTALEEAWSALHDATPKGWYVGRPTYYGRAARVAPVRLRSVRAARGRAPAEGVDGDATKLQFMLWRAFERILGGVTRTEPI